MTLKDISNGPDWIMWVVFAIMALISVLLLLGRGSWLIAGYNTASKEDKDKYNQKKLCRVIGVGMSVITIMILIMTIWQEVLPASFATVFGVVTLVDCVVMIVMASTVCRRG